MLELYGKKCYSGHAARVVRVDISWTFRPLRVRAWVQTQHKLGNTTSSKDQAQQRSWLGSWCCGEENLSPDPAKQPAVAGAALLHERWIWFLLLHKREGFPHSSSSCEANWLLVWSVPYFCGDLLLQMQHFVEEFNRYDSLIIFLEGAAYCSYLITSERAGIHPGFLEMSTAYCPGGGLCQDTAAWHTTASRSTNIPVMGECHCLLIA